MMCAFIKHAFYLIAVLAYSDSLSLNKVSEVKEKDDAVQGPKPEFYPDWVPFKNKHGDELGTFVDVAPKAKVKKRLALPINFVLKAVAESGDEDYYTGGGSDNDGEEVYEKKDWTDVDRPEYNATNKHYLNHTDLSDIDGVVSIIKDIKPSAIAQAIEESSQQHSRKHEEEKDYDEDASKEKKDVPEKEEEDVPAKEDQDEEKETKQIEKDEEVSLNSEEIKEHKSNVKEEEKDPTSGEEEEDDDETATTTENPKKEPTEEEKENEAKKAKVLAQVDELKERHQKESKWIQEKARSEEEDSEEYIKHAHNRHEDKDYRYKQVNDDVSSDEEEDESKSVEDKYEPKPKEQLTTSTTTTHRPRTSVKHKQKVTDANGDLRFFANHDDDEYRGNDKTTTPIPKSTKSSDYVDHVRISLIPEDDNENPDTPTLFFPQKRKIRRRKNSSRTRNPNLINIRRKPTKASKVPTAIEEYLTATESPEVTAYTNVVTRSVANDIEETEKPDKTTSTTDDTAPSASAEEDVTSPIKAYPVREDGRIIVDAAASGSDTAPSALDVESAPSAEDAVSTGTHAVTDALPASTNHKKEEPQNSEHEKGGEKEYHSEHKEEKGEHGKKAYESVHKDSKTAKGHHDKEDHQGKYDDHGGYDKHHHDEKGHYGSHHHEEHGKKHAKYEESGKHSKGHSTKGSHDVHKKEEYEKKVEFFEEEGDSAEEEKHGGYHNEKGHKEGGNFKKGQHKAEHEHQDKGKSGHFAKGGHALGHKAHKESAGHDSHVRKGHDYFHKDHKDGGKKWVYHQGYPAKTANLVVIDRRGDRYMNGPSFYGGRPFYG